MFYTLMKEFVAWAEVEGDWFENVSEIVAASRRMSTALGEGGASKDVHFFLEMFVEGERSSKFNSDSDSSCTAGRGFHDTDIVLIEAKSGETGFLGSGVLLQNLSTWGKADESSTSFF